jgi:hypothetical protein
METGPVVAVTTEASVLGWRVWIVREHRDGIRLGSVLHDEVWSPGSPARAICQLGDHAAPDASCNCGFHAAQDPVDAFPYLHGRDEPGTLGRVLGEVALSGVVVRTETGWRAEQAYPLRLYLRAGALAAALAAYGISVLSPAWSSASATSSSTDSAGSPTSSWSAAPTRSSPGAASG